ncbi:hypothetical protein NCCP2222_23500 [Sporosarcina sp. NCCP-2222]|uniref:hypothetical protein n=1 Tax=Sporosarcina sp. NCCP-2222 TaxID=2935073 RepID=UPI00208B618C|nr:hypothetical protein [Sporosarcina sp. NCCP-2222]GKV56403.1 hypothetical protein NCCP2222_23500 [Sporosarcina sp. NCCP-2222]
MKFEDFVQDTGYYLTFEQALRAAVSGVNLRIVVNRSREKVDLLLHPHLDGDVTTYFIDFPYYVTYMVTVEDYTHWNDYNTFRGDDFRIYDQSTLLDYYYEEQNVARELYNKPLVHYMLGCHDIIVDILSYTEPTITKVDAECN